VRALLGAHYPLHEVVVVNDGSRDGTLAVLVEAFSLVQVERVPRANLPTAPLRGVYACPHDDRLIVIDKENGGKADAINCGLDHARYPLFCTIDSDTIIDDDALLRLVRPFQAEPTTVACGGVVRIANGSVVRHGRVVEVRTPRALTVNIQIVEYLRAFLAGRAGWARLQSLLIISGAFGVFRWDTVVAAGGYDTRTVGEDAELVVRLHRYCRERGIPYRVDFIADPVCWTEAPSSLRVLFRQRNRWHRGLVETLLRHRGMIGRRRYGPIGLFAMPYFAFFEAAGPLLEAIGYVVTIASLLIGVIDPLFAAVLFGLATSYGLVLSFGALLIEDRAFRRYRSWRCVGRMVVAAVVENFGYRQLASFVRAYAFVTLVRGRSGWGEMTRAGFGGPT
jgi:cellulose synthase/poly-beta-1,6-N-acetylglucosamine synthase-like glycosyltransferase